jgi:hypothetical protein
VIDLSEITRGVVPKPHGYKVCLGTTPRAVPSGPGCPPDSGGRATRSDGISANPRPAFTASMTTRFSQSNATNGVTDRAYNSETTIAHLANVQQTNGQLTTEEGSRHQLFYLPTVRLRRKTPAVLVLEQIVNGTRAKLAVENLEMISADQGWMTDSARSA